MEDTQMKIGERFSRMTAAAGDQAEELADRAALAAESAGEKAQRTAHRAGTELESFLDDVEDLVRRTTHLTEGEVAGTRTRIEERLSAVRENATRNLDDTANRTRRVARATDEYVRGNPWSTIGAVALAGFAIGALLRRR
jgi:ElaB/YqjD/DUF883 family membrane-anchored ribosome-binding protein